MKLFWNKKKIKILYKIFLFQLNLEVTVTKTCLDTVANLGKAFRQAASLGSSKSKNMAPIVVKNETGYSLTIYLIGTRYKVISILITNSNLY